MIFSKKNVASTLDLDNIPEHVAIIMDGNGRWAKKRGLPRTVGHSAGSEAFHNAATILAEIGVKHMSVYAFSTENWKRPQDEVSEIMSLLEKYLNKSINELVQNNIQLEFWGDLSALSPKLRELIAKTEELSQKCDGMHVNICLNYGARDEILHATRNIAQKCASGEINACDIDENMFEQNLYSKNAPPPDLLIRPGAEQRISNFLLWQCAYSEFYFTDTLWPDFDKKEIYAAIADYQSRVRRFGGLK